MRKEKQEIGKYFERNGSIVKQLLELGVDLSTRSAVKSALSLIGEDISSTEEIYIELMNELNRNGFKKTRYDERALFLPQCLRNAEKCKAKMSEVGYICEGCGSCSILSIKKEAEGLGYKVYILPGGSMVWKILGKNGFKGVAGVACKFELCEALEKINMTPIQAYGVPLLRDGCRNTAVDVKKVLGIIRQKT